MKLHKGDPCEYCGLPHDDVPIGDCKGTDAPDFDPLQLPFLVVSVHEEAMKENDDLREFLLVLRRALLMVVNWIEQRYRLGPEPTYCDGCQKKINRNS